jgi:hypothetical protein
LWCGDFDGGVGEEFEVPVGVVGEVVVVAPAQEHKVVLVGSAALVPRNDVMGFRPGHGPVAAGEAAALVADRQRGEEVVVDGAGGAAGVQDD